MATASGSKKRQFSYYDMPDSHKRKFCIGGSPENYREIINWLRAICCREGSVFKGIPSLNPSSKPGVYPFVQVKVVSLDKKSAEFMICKNDLHMIAFTSTSKSKVISKSKCSGKVASKVDFEGRVVSSSKVWIQFNHHYQIDGWNRLNAYKSGAYSKDIPPKTIGPGHMSSAVNSLNQDNASKETNVEACEIFFVHLCEAARFRPIEFMVYKSLALRIVRKILRKTKKSYMDQRLEEFEVEEENRLLYDSGIYNEKEEENIVLEYPRDGMSVSVDRDIYSLIKAVGPINPGFTSEDRSNYLDKLVKSHDDLSQLWYIYSLSGRRVFDMASDWPMLSMLYMRYVKSVRFTVAVLCCPNIKDLLPVLRVKFNKEVEDNKEALKGKGNKESLKVRDKIKALEEAYKIIEDKIRELQKSGEI